MGIDAVIADVAAVEVALNLAAGDIDLVAAGRRRAVAAVDAFLVRAAGDDDDVVVRRACRGLAAVDGAVDDRVTGEIQRVRVRRACGTAAEDLAFDRTTGKRQRIVVCRRAAGAAEERAMDGAARELGGVTVGGAFGRISAKGVAADGAARHGECVFRSVSEIRHGASGAASHVTFHGGRVLRQRMRGVLRGRAGRDVRGLFAGIRHVRRDGVHRALRAFRKGFLVEEEVDGLVCFVIRQRAGVIGDDAGEIVRLRGLCADRRAARVRSDLEEDNLFDIIGEI